MSAIKFLPVCLAGGLVTWTYLIAKGPSEGNRTSSDWDGQYGQTNEKLAAIEWKQSQYLVLWDLEIKRQTFGVKWHVSLYYAIVVVMISRLSMDGWVGGSVFRFGSPASCCYWWPNSQFSHYDWRRRDAFDACVKTGNPKRVGLL